MKKINWIQPISICICLLFCYTTSSAQVLFSSTGHETEFDASFIVPSGDDRLLIVHAMAYEPGTAGLPEVLSVTIDGQPLTELAIRNFNSTSAVSSFSGVSTIWYKTMGSNTTDDGAKTLTVTINDAQFSGMGIIVFDKVDQVNPISNVINKRLYAMEANPAASTIFVNSAPGNMVFDALYYISSASGIPANGSGHISEGEFQTPSYNFTNMQAGLNFMGGSFQEGASTTPMSWEISSPPLIGGGAHFGLSINSSSSGSAAMVQQTNINVINIEASNLLLSDDARNSTEEDQAFIQSVFDNPELYESTLNLFPNPAVNQLEISGLNAASGQYWIYNQLGQVELEGQWQRGKQIDIQTLSQGIYVFEYLADGFSEVAQFIKQ